MFSSLRSTCAVMTVCVMLSACTTNPQTQGQNGVGGQRPLTTDEQRLQELTDSYNGTVVTGALVGCLAGGLIGALVSGKNNRGAGAGIGCAAGGVAGAGTGVVVANANERAALTEDSLRQQIMEAQAFNNSLDKNIVVSRNLVREAQSRLESLKIGVARGTATRQQLQDEVKGAEGTLQIMEGNLNAAINRRNEYARMAQQIPQIKSQIRDMDGKIMSIQRDCDILRGTMTISPVG